MTSLAPALAREKTARIDQVLGTARRLPFVVLVRWLERLLHASAPVGALGPVHAEAVRFRHDPGLGFHDADLVDATWLEPAAPAEAGRLVQLTTSFLGLTGAASPLPPALIEHLCCDDNDENAVQREFLDLFHHRLTGLAYRGLLKCDLPRSSEPDGRGRALDWVLLMAGLAPAHAERLTGLSRAQLLSLAPLLVTYPRNVDRIAAALRFVLHDLLDASLACAGTARTDGAELRIFQLRGRLAELEPSSRVRLGVDLRLGQRSALGQRAPAPASELVVHIAALPPAACASLRPGGDRFASLSAVVSLFCPETIRVAVELSPTSTPPAHLGTAGGQLARNAWLHGRGRPRPICFVLEHSGPRSHPHASGKRSDSSQTAQPYGAMAAVETRRP